MRTEINNPERLIKTSKKPQLDKIMSEPKEFKNQIHLKMV